MPCTGSLFNYLAFEKRTALSDFEHSDGILVDIWQWIGVMKMNTPNVRIPYGTFVVPAFAAFSASMDNISIH